MIANIKTDESQTCLYYLKLLIDNHLLTTEMLTDKNMVKC